MTDDQRSLHALSERQASFKLSNGKKRKTTTATTSEWPLPLSHSVTPSALASAGFYHAPLTDAEDNATCFLCGKGLGGWEDGDVAIEEHVNHSIKASVKKGCPFALLVAGSAKLQELRLEEGKELVKMRKDTFGKKSKYWVHAGQRGWPTPDKMANAGFFLNATEPQSDAVQCCWCSLTLDGWEKADEPLHEHYKRKPQCHFFEANPALASQAREATAPEADEAPGPPATDEGWEELIPDPKPKTKKSTRSGKKDTGADESALLNESQMSFSSAAPLARSTRSGMISNLASSQQSASTSQPLRSSRSTRSAATAAANQTQDASVMERLDGVEEEADEAEAPASLPQKPASKSKPSSSSSSSNNKAKGKAKAKPRSPSPPPPVSQPAPSVLPHEDQQHPADLEGAVSSESDSEPERIQRPEAELNQQAPPPAAPEASTATTHEHLELSAVQEEAEVEDVDTNTTSDAKQASSQTSNGIPSLLSQSHQLPRARSSARAAKENEEEDLLAGLDEAQLNMGVKEWFQHLMDVEMTRARSEMQGRLDEYDRQVEGGWDKLRSMGLA